MSQDCKEIRSRCLKLLGADIKNQSVLVELTESMLNEGQFDAALALARSACRDYPDNAVFYGLAARACNALGKFDDAEQACVEQMGRADDSFDAWQEYARIAAARKAPSLAAGRWLAVRRKFPARPEGYIEGVRTALELKDWRAAAEICREAWTRSPETRKKITIPPEHAANFFAWAREPLSIQHQMEALRRLEIIISLFPAKKEAWLESAQLYIFQQRPRKAREICLASFNALGLTPEMFAFLIEACFMDNRETEGVNYCYLGSAIFSGDKNQIETIIYKLLGQGNWHDALAIFKRHEDIFPNDMATARLRLAMAQERRPEQEAENLTAYFRDCQRLFAPEIPVSWENRVFLNVLAMSAKNDLEKARLHKALFETLVAQMPSLPANAENFPKKLCYYGQMDVLFYISAVVRHIPPAEIDLVLTDYKSNPDLLKERGLEKYNIINENRLGDYQYILTDTLTKMTPGQGQTLICFPHAVDNTGAKTMTRAGALILPFHNSLGHHVVKLAGDEYKLLSSLSPAQKCEICVTGPFHIENNLPSDKNELRGMIERQYGISIAPDKPFVYVVDGENVLFSHMVYALNKISRYATVIYKTCYAMPADIRKRLNNNVKVITGGYANNLLRFAADFIIADYFSGTCMSSIMLGLPVIACYSTLCKHKSPTAAHIKPLHYLKNIYWYDRAAYRKFWGKLPKPYMLWHMRNQDMLFNILDSEKIEHFILDSFSLKAYARQLPALQKETFVEYMKEGSSGKTAELIRRFANTGTFGEDCAAVNLEKV